MTQKLVRADDPITIEKLFDTSYKILQWEKLPQNKGKRQQQIIDEKLRHFGGRLQSLVQALYLNELEIGWLCVQGEDLKLYLYASYDNMMDWIKNGLGITDYSIISRATQKYKCWLYAKDLGIPIVDIIKADQEKILAIGQARKDLGDERRKLQEQYFQENRRNALSQGEDYPEKQRNLSSDQRDELDRQVNETCRERAIERVQSILSDDPLHIATDLASTGGKVVRPVFYLNTHIVGNTIQVLPSFLTIESPAYLDAMDHEKAKFVFCLPDGKKYSQSELSDKCREKFTFEEE